MVDDQGSNVAMATEAAAGQGGGSRSSLSPEELSGLIATAYYHAAKSGATMRPVTDVLETLRSGLVQTERLFGLVETVDRHIGLATDILLQAVLVQLRADLLDRVITGVLDGVRRTMAIDPEAAWTDWRRAYAEAVAQFRCPATIALVRAELDLPQDLRTERDRYGRFAMLLAHERWPEAIDLILELANSKEINSTTRAILCVLAAEIQIYHLLDGAEAKRLLEAADSLTGDTPRTHFGWGEYWISEGDFDRAKEHAERAVTMAPGESDGFQVFGQVAEKAGSLEEAEGWYRQAIAANPGDAGSYRYLLRLYGQANQLESHEPLLAPILERIISLDPAGDWARYSAWLEMAAIYQQNARYDVAIGWFERARDLDPTRMAAFAGLGFLYVERGEYAEAVEAFTEASNLAPESFDPHWALGFTFEQLNDLDQALASYRDSLARRPSWGAIVRTKIGEVLGRLGRGQEAATELLAVLRASPDDVGVATALHARVESLYQREANVEGALGLLQEILAIRGQAYEPEFWNRVGNAHFYVNDFERAADSYRRAIERDAAVAVYHMNLAGALRGMGQWDPARAEVEAAFAVDHDEQAKAAALALIENARGNAHTRAGEFEAAAELFRAATKLDPVDPIYHSNVAFALENVVAHGRRLDAMREAIVELRLAIERDPQNREYPDRIRALESRLSLAGRLGETSLDQLPMVAILAVSLGPEVAEEFAGPGPSGLSDDVLRLIDAISDEVRAQTGLSIPGIRFRALENAESPGAYIVFVREVAAGTGTVHSGRWLATGPPGALGRFDGPPGTDPLTGVHGVWIDESLADEAAAGSLQVLTRRDVVLRHVQRAAMSNLDTLLNVDSVTELLTQTDDDACKRILESSSALQEVTQVLASLAGEEVSLAPLGHICRRFVEGKEKGEDIPSIAESIRSLPELISTLPGNEDGVSHYSLPAGVEQLLERSLEQHPPGRVLAVAPQTLALVDMVAAIESTGPIALVVRAGDLRPFVRAMLRQQAPRVPVLAMNELARHLRTGVKEIEPIGLSTAVGEG